MKKKLFYILISIVFILFLGYKFIHFYTDPTCTEAATCYICHKTKGEPLGHDFTPANCTEPEICSRCLEIGKPALGHDYENLTSTYHICNRCLHEDGYLEKCNEKGTYLVYNFDYNKILCSQNEDNHLACASLTKLVTVPLALQYLDLDEKITIGDEIDLLKPHSSKAGLVKNDVLTVKQLVRACLIPSGNDAAYVLAYNTALKVNSNFSKEEAVSYFIEMMNEYVKSIGCADSLFCSPDGLDYENQYTTCNDLLKIANKAIEYEVITDTCKLSSIKETSQNGLVYTWKNSNQLLQPLSEYYDSNVTGLKTGTTPLAKNCLITLLENNNLKYLIITLNNETNDARYLQAKSLIKYVN